MTMLNDAKGREILRQWFDGAQPRSKVIRMAERIWRRIRPPSGDWVMDELETTAETLIELDEPEALLTTLRRAAQRRKGDRWTALAKVLGAAEVELDQILNGKPQPPADNEARSE